MYHLGFLLVIMICLSVIGYIIFSKFPQLRNLDVDALPEEKQYRKKKEIINKRLQSEGEQIKNKISIYLQPVKKWWGKLQLKFRIYVGKIQRLMHHEQELNKKENQEENIKSVEEVEENEINSVVNLPSRAILSSNETTNTKSVQSFFKRKTLQKENEKQIEEIAPKKNEIEIDKEKLNNLILEAERYLENSNYEKAEEKFISAIKIDQKNVVAYRGLADTYFAKGAVEEARETYRFVLQLENDDDRVMVKLAEIAESQGDIEEAIQRYDQAIMVNDSFAPRFYNMARLLLKINQPATAKEAAVQAVALDSENISYLDLLLEIAIILRDTNLAWDTYGELRRVDPKNKKLEMYHAKISVLI